MSFWSMDSNELAVVGALIVVGFLFTIFYGTYEVKMRKCKRDIIESEEFTDDLVRQLVDNDLKDQLDRITSELGRCYSSCEIDSIVLNTKKQISVYVRGTIVTGATEDLEAASRQVSFGLIGAPSSYRQYGEKHRVDASGAEIFLRQEGIDVGRIDRAIKEKLHS